MLKRYTYMNYCSKSCVSGISYDENGFAFVTKCSQTLDQKCPVGNGTSEYFSNEADIVKAGDLETCYSGYNFCKVIFFFYTLRILALILNHF